MADGIGQICLMSGTYARSRLALLLAFLMLGSVISQFPAVQNGIDQWEESQSSSPKHPPGSRVLHPSLNETTSIIYTNGTRITEVEFDFGGGPVQQWQNNTLNAGNPLFSNGMFQQTTLGTAGIELSTTTISGSGSIPGVGTQNMTVLGLTTWNGTHTFDVLRVQCGIIAPCGTIIADGPLTIIANEIVIASGGAIHADSSTWGGSGRGGNGSYGYSSPTGPQSYNYGAGGAGHGGDGGDGGNANGSTNQGAGGSAYGNGSESGSSGGNISSLGGGTRAIGGRGGGQLTLIARNITITGILSADGEDGVDGASPSNGSGPGNHGAGGGSGGGILLQAQQLSVTQWGQVSALGGDGGDGSAAQASATGGWGPNNAGGHGGGGGGGGRIAIITLANGYSNQGTVSLAPGSSGSGGAGSGTGSAGSAGTNGTAGVITTSTFSGWGSAAGAPWPSSGTLNVNGTLNMQGNHSYNTVHVSGSGLIDSTGARLQITANTIIIEANGAIRSDGTVWGGHGHGALGSHAGNSGIGANGGAHLGAGGVGGGNGNRTNMSYGNGTESGSAGGNVTQTTSAGVTTVKSVGGRGGGLIILIANNIYINGTITANGEDGANGRTPANGGRGVAGAGGGSGGSVLIIANNVWWGQTGSVIAKGGDGGDGSNGMLRQPISLLMYDGGDGGGGGGGGAVNITTTANGIHGNGRISVFGGSAGTGGQPYGSGTAGRAGSSGSAGWSQVSTTFTGWAGTPRVPSGTWTSEALGVGEIVEGLTLHVNHIILGGTAVSGEFRTTVDNVTWSEWQQLNLTAQSTDRLRHFQLRLNLNTSSDQSTPTITGLSYEAWWWAALEGERPLAFSITSSLPATEDWRVGDANGQDPLGNGVRLFHSAEWRSTSGPPPSTGNPYTGKVEVPVPLDAVPQSGWIHLSALGLNQTNNVTLSVGRAQLASVDNDDTAYDIALDAAALAAAWPTSGSSDASGMEWGWLELNWTSETPSPVFSHLSLPWNLTHRVGGGGEFVTGIEAMVMAECTEWYLVQGCRHDFPVMATGISSVLDLAIHISNLAVTSIDDMAPRLGDVKMEVDGVETTVARHGDMLIFLVTDRIGEQNLTILCLLELSGQNSTAAPDQMQWSAQRHAYQLQYDSAQYASPGTQTLLDFSCDMQDDSGNSANPSPSLQVSIQPGPPVVTDFVLSSSSGPFSGGMLTGTWRHDEPITFTVEELTDRAGLDASVELTRREGGEVTSIPLAWDDFAVSYTGVWSTGRYDFGVWDAEVKLVDVQLSDMDEDGARPSTDATVTIVDRLAPSLVAVSFDWSPTNPYVWRTTIEWSAETDESIAAAVDVSTDEGEHVDRLLIYSTSDTTGYADWDTTDAEPGRYHLEVSLEDSAGNPAPDWLPGPDGELVIVPPRKLTLEVLAPADGTEFVLGDTVTYRLAISCNDGCAMVLEEESLAGLSNGTLEFNRTLTDVGDVSFFFTLSAGDLNITEMSHIKVVAPPDPLFSLPSCVDGSVDDSEMALAGHREFDCNVNNMGEVSATVRFRVTDGHPKFTCMPTTPQTVLVGNSLDVTCRTQGDVEQATEISTTAVFEWQDHLGNWHRIGSEQPFSVSLKPSSGGAQGDLDSAQGLGLSTLTITGALVGLLALFGIGIATVLLVRRQRRDDEDQGIDSDHLDYGGVQAIHTDGAITGGEPEPAAEPAGPDWVASYEELPAGGRYEEVPEGMWYIDADEHWWWCEHGGSWRRV